MEGHTSRHDDRVLRVKGRIDFWINSTRLFCFPLHTFSTSSIYYISHSCSGLTEMYRYEPRDKSGPMEVDNPDPMARLAQYAIPQEDGPSRKRQSPIICVS
jgi:hypothetical protein